MLQELDPYNQRTKNETRGWEGDDDIVECHHQTSVRDAAPSLSVSPLASGSDPHRPSAAIANRPCCTDRSLGGEDWTVYQGPVSDHPGQPPCHSKRTKIAVITSRSSGTE
jgi:hypothetical protein